MFRTAVLRLTLAYLLMLMALSIIFSYIFYHFSNEQLTKELQTPSRYELSEPNIFLNFTKFRDTRLGEAQRQLMNDIVLLNLGTLIFGSILSYALAQRTIQPIEKALEAQSRFTADASHELRTPLTTLQTEIEVSLRDKKLSLKGARDQLSSNLEEVIKLHDLSDRLLRLARDEQEMKLAKVNFQTAVKQAVAQTEPLATGKQINIDNQTTSIEVVANQQHLQDVLIILLDNAIKYSPPSTSVVVKSRRRGNYGLIEVVDQGKGIKKSDLPHIFDRFFRGDHSRSKDIASGYGLGLSIAHKLITAQRGSISAKSIVNKGSTFTIKLPLAY